MNDMSSVIVPKSDQHNAEDFLSGPKSFTIDSVAISPGTEQPVSIRLVGEDRVWRPCKSMSRVLVAAWGPDARAYVGRSVTLYCDPKVKWGGMEVGGIRISHLSHIERDMTIALTATKGKRAVTIIKPLANAPAQQPKADPMERFANGYMNRVDSIQSADELEEYAASKAGDIERLAGKRADLAKQCAVVLDRRRSALKEGRSDDQHGDQFDGTGDDPKSDDDGFTY